MEIIKSLLREPWVKELMNVGDIYLVGGIVRDYLLEKKDFKDVDLLITKIPVEGITAVLDKYGKVSEVGKSFGIIKFKAPGYDEDIDIAIPRTEIKTGEGHQGFEVTSDHMLDVKDDLMRRDFTINAIAMKLDGTVVDPFGGVQDLKNGIIRMVNPKAFAEDPLRMMRAIQFSSRFKFKIENNTLKSIVDNANSIAQIPAERILIEIDKIYEKCDFKTGMSWLITTNLFGKIFQRMASPPKINDIDFNRIHTRADFYITLLGERSPDIFFSKLKGDYNTTIEMKAVLAAMDVIFESKPQMRHLVFQINKMSPDALKSGLLNSHLKEAVNELTSEQYPIDVNQLAVNGHDLMEMGFTGVKIGDMQMHIIDAIYNDVIVNEKDSIMDYVMNGAPTQKQDESNDYGNYDPISWLMFGKKVPR